MPPAKALSTELKLQRIHVGGLAPSVTPKDLVQRFSSFGVVQGGEHGVDGLGKSENGTLDFLTTSVELQCADRKRKQVSRARMPSSTSRRLKPSSPVVRFPLLLLSRDV